MSDLSSRVYKKLLEVPRGKVTTYAELAKDSRVTKMVQDDARKHGKKQSTSALSYGRSTSKKILKSVYCIIHVYDKAIVKVRDLTLTPSDDNS